LIESLLVRSDSVKHDVTVRKFVARHNIRRVDRLTGDTRVPGMTDRAPLVAGDGINQSTTEGTHHPRTNSIHYSPVRDEIEEPTFRVIHDVPGEVVVDVGALPGGRRSRRRIGLLVAKSVNPTRKPS
jgi:hypothetical protein